MHGNARYGAVCVGGAIVILFIVGLFTGALAGVFLASLCWARREADEAARWMWPEWVWEDSTGRCEK